MCIFVCDILQRVHKECCVPRLLKGDNSYFPISNASGVRICLFSVIVLIFFSGQQFVLI